MLRVSSARFGMDLVAEEKVAVETLTKIRHGARIQLASRQVVGNGVLE